MKRTSILFATLLCLAACTTRDKSFEGLFTGEGLRIDYYAAGDRKSETAELISMARTPLWSGPHGNLVEMELGDYRIMMTDAKSGDTLYVQGFSTLFSEWRTTAEALTKTEKYYSSKTVPMPKKPAKIFIENRNRHTMEFSVIGTFDVNPSEIVPFEGPANDVTEIRINGEPRCKADLTFVAEGYTAQDKDKFIADAERFTKALFECPPFDKHPDDFNVRAVMVASEDQGTDLPGLGIWKNTAMNSNFYTFGTDRYLTTADMKPVADAVWDVPTDAIFILVNEPTYGGGGIFNFYAIGTSDNPRTLGVFVHEFGHSFGALADEYFDRSTAYEEDVMYDLKVEPWEHNITTLVDFDKKWKSWHDGLYEGGGYLPKGIWRPEEHCMMRDYHPFCPVCSRCIEERIDWFCDR